MYPQFDERDEQIKRDRQRAFDAQTGPRVGDFLKTDKGYLRFTYDWNEKIQTTDRPSASGETGSFYLGNGFASYSGSLDPSISKLELVSLDETKEGRFWFFHHDFQQAHNGVEFTLPCRVYKHQPIVANEDDPGSWGEYQHIKKMWEAALGNR